MLRPSVTMQDNRSCDGANQGCVALAPQRDDEKAEGVLSKPASGKRPGTRREAGGIRVTGGAEALCIARWTCLRSISPYYEAI